jgi:class 3 adenylate cyclase
MNGLFNVLAFRYQIIFILLLVLGLSFGGILLLVQQQFDRQIIPLIQQELQQDAALLQQQMAAREAVLLADAQALAHHVAQLGLFTLDETPLDIIALRRAGILPFNGSAEYLFIIREDGVVTRANVPHEHAFVNKLPEWQRHTQNNAPQRTEWFQVRDYFYQVSSVAVDGTPPARGRVFVAQSLPSLHDLLGAQRGVVLFDSHGRVLHTTPLHFDLPRYQDEFSALFQTTSSGHQGLIHNHFIYHLHTLPLHGMPPFMLVYPLHNYLNFISNNVFALLGLGLVVIFISAFLLRLFNHHIHDILHALLIAIEQVERENYSFRLSLPKRDELVPLVDSMNEMLKSLEQRERLHGVMEQIVSRAVAEEMLEKHADGKGGTYQGSILVADICGFCTLTQTMSAAQMLEFLNDYLGRMSYCVDARNGEVDSYQSDTLVAVFGLHQHSSTHIMDALQCAFDMHEALHLFNLEMGEPLGITIDIAIGISSGDLIAGSVGTVRRASYAVLGGTVKRAQHLQILAAKYPHGIIVDSKIQQEIGRQTADIIHLGAKISLPHGEYAYQIIPRRRLNRSVNMGVIV